jgi:predicted O-linked N-acetylglucosamine transferase (SPINDLY family)
LGCSLNRALGLEELVCPDEAAYVARAVLLAGSPERLARLRQQQAQSIEAKGFFDPRRSAAAIEGAIAVFA